MYFGWKICVGIHGIFFAWKIVSLCLMCDDVEGGNNCTFNGVELLVMEL